MKTQITQNRFSFCLILILMIGSLFAVPPAQSRLNPQAQGRMVETVCHRCDGSGRMWCVHCAGTGKAAAACPYSDDPVLSSPQKCGLCDGTGAVRCVSCGGTGKYSIYIKDAPARGGGQQSPLQGRQQAGFMGIQGAVEADLQRLGGSYSGMAADVRTRQKFRVSYSITSAGIGGTFYFPNGSSYGFSGALDGKGRLVYLLAPGCNDGSGRMYIQNRRLCGVLRFKMNNGGYWNVVLASNRR